MITRVVLAALAATSLAINLIMGGALMANKAEAKRKAAAAASRKARLARRMRNRRKMMEVWKEVSFPQESKEKSPSTRQ